MAKPGTPTIVGGPARGGGARHSSNAEAKSLVIQLDRRMPIIQQDAAILATMLMKTSKKKVGAQVWYHHEDELMPTTVTFTGDTETSADSSPLVIDFTNNKAIFEDVILWNPRSNVHILSTDTPDAYTTGDFAFTRDLYSVGSDLLVKGDVLKILSPAREIGDDAPLARHTTEVLKTFGMQNIRHAKAITDVQEATETYHGNDRIRQNDKMAQEVKIQLELNIWFANYSADIGGSTFEQPTMKGINSFVTSNKTYIDLLTYPELEAALEAPSEYHGNGAGWFAFGGPKVMRIINGFGRDYLQTSVDDSVFGRRLSMLRTTFGDVELVNCPLFTGDYLSGMLFFVPKPIEDFIQLRYLAGNGTNHDFKLFRDQQQPSSELIVDEIKGKVGTELWEEPKWAAIWGIIG